MKIKICGLTNPEEIAYINEFMPDYAGFIFASFSKRYISYEKAAELKKQLSPEIKSVGVFVNETIKNIIDIIDMKIIDMVQLHGDETNFYIDELRKMSNIPVIKAYRADGNIKSNINNTNADYILIDSFNNNLFGGTGNTFNWGIIPKNDKKIFLAGGLNINNIEEAIRLVNPYCADISSGVETNGKKDKNKIRDIIKKIKGYRNE